MRIEPAGMADLDTVVDQWLHLARDQRAYGSHLRADANERVIRFELAAHIADDTLLVARTDRILGFVSFGIPEGSLEEDTTRGVIHNLYVIPAARNEGVGSRLIEAAETELANRGASVVALEVLARNHAARRLYLTHGYTPHRLEYETTLNP